MSRSYVSVLQWDTGSRPELAPCILTQYFWIHMCVCLAVEDTVNRRPWFLDFFSPFWLLHSSCLLFCPEAWMEGYDGLILLELKIPRSFTHYMPSSCESLYSFSSTEGRCLSDGELREALIYKPHEMSLKVVLFLLAERYNLIFSQCQVLSGLRFLVSWAGLRLNSSSLSGPQIQSYIGWPRLQTCTTTALAQRGHHWRPKAVLLFTLCFGSKN